MLICWLLLIGADEGQEGGICEVCITQLRNAANFKKQVQHTEEQFKRRLEDNMFKPTIVKLEVAPIDDDVGDQSDNNHSDDMSVTEYEVPIKTETEETKGKKRTKGATTRSKKTKVEDAETSKSRKRVSFISLNQTKIIKINPKPEIELKKRGEIDKQLENLATILVYSNATPIRRKGCKGYACCFCEEEYYEAKDLKTHTLTTHEEIKSTFKKGYSMLDYVVKLDITSLTCNLCDANCDSLDDLIKHLTSRHDKPYHTKLKNYIIPFKFDKEIFECVECYQQFNNFKILLVHMNCHYRNHICNICDVGFVNRKIMLAHRYRHKKGVFVCPQCNKTFDAKVKQKEHERAVHVNFQKRYRCGFCNEKFTDYIKKNDHEVKMHGAKPLVLNCQACEKTFSNQRALNLHVKSYHLLESQMRKSEMSSKKSEKQLQKQRKINSFND